MVSVAPTSHDGPASLAEEEVRISENRYRGLFEGAKDGVLLLEAKTGKVLDANPFLMELLGYSLAELVGMNLWDIGPFKDIAASEAAFAELQARDYIRYENLPLETKDGQRREVEFISNAYLAGGVRFIQCNIRDISRRKRDDLERGWLTDILDERSLNEIYFYDAQTLAIAHVNEGGRRNLGYSLEQLRTMSIVDIRPEFDAESVHAMLGPLLRKEETLHVFQTTQRRADASTYPVEVHLQMVQRQGMPMVLAVALDITARQFAEQSLRESEERYRLLIERSPDAIFIHCADKIVFANPATLLLFGAERPEQVLGRNILEIMHPDSQANIEERIRHVAEGTKTPLMEQKLVRLDGHVVEVEAMGIASIFNGQPAVQVILRDITEKKQLEAQSLRSQRMESIGSLAAGIAHDLNNALAPILMANTILRDSSTEPNDVRIFEIIDRGAQHAAAMVKQVLTFARGAEVERSAIDIHGLVDELGTIARHTFPQSVQLTTSVAPETWPLAGNATQIHQVLLNLCVNARDAMPEGGLLTLHVGNVQIESQREGVPAEGAPGAYVCITITDTGTGMPPEIAAQIFDPFYTTKDPGKGTGLGLSTARKIITTHGGFIQVQSALGIGTEFRVYLPAQFEDAGAPVELGRLAPPIGHGEWILLVDDEAAIRIILAQTLESCGYRVAMASDGPQAVALCARDPAKFRLLITDMDMPIMDGAATMLAIRAISTAIKTIATSGSRSRGGASSFSEAQAFLPKPYSAAELLQLVHDVLLNEAAPPAPTMVIE